MPGPRGRSCEFGWPAVLVDQVDKYEEDIHRRIVISVKDPVALVYHHILRNGALIVSILNSPLDSASPCTVLRIALEKTVDFFCLFGGGT